MLVVTGSTGHVGGLVARELAEIASTIGGGRYAYAPKPDVWWEARWRARGKAEWEIEAGLSSYAALRADRLPLRA